MEIYKFQAKNQQGLLEKALEQLQLTEEDVLTNIYEEKSGLFGKKITLEVVKINDVVEIVKNSLKELLSGLNIEANIESKVRNRQMKFEIHSKNNAVLIGKNGHILESIQTYIRQVVFNTVNMYANITIDVENYKEKQNYFLEKKVKKIARDVTLSKMDVKLDPMNSYERRLVHAALQGFEYITTESEGEEPNRCVVIKYCEKKDE